ncbi:MAG: AbrB/MazE/SpoVT family DNA-binding domain-containing protein [Rhizobiales bacterium]|nr:AbrB/MazE/SpoVT family DNA-binding domain-containing protein [Hyphomicrobiales bacterium]
MLSSTVTAKGQTTIPAEIRRKLALKPGDRLLYLEEEGRVRIVAAARRAADLKGLLPRPERPVGLEDMDQVIATGRARR